jgi:endoglucanase
MHPYRTLAIGTAAAVVGGTLFAAAMPSAAAGTAAVPRAVTPAAGAGFWHTSGNQILDSAGNPVKIAGINWYGFETTDQIAHGLWAQDYHAVIDDIKNLGYNTIRIPFSNQMVEKPVVPQNFSTFNSGPINTDLVGQTSLQDLDKIVAYAGQDGLKVILDDHRSDAGNSAEENGLWYTSAFPSANWVNDWTTMAKRYAGNPTVIGFDLRNEPHTPAGLTYAQGATWGTGDPATDVRLAYQNAGNAVLAADPNALVFVEGIGETPNSAGGFDSTWWGGDLALAGQFPVTLSSPGHVVYSAHDYGPSLFQQTWFNASTTPASLAAVWDKFWGYLYKQNIAPLWVGEFGTGNAATDVQSTSAGSQGQWFSSLVSYIGTNTGMGWTYWALNGEDSFALLDNSYSATPVSAAKQSLLQGIQFPLTPGTGGGGTTPPPTTTPPPPPATHCSVAYSVTNAWQGGFQAQVVLTNTGTATINNWTLAWTFGSDQAISNMWGATSAQTGQHVNATAASYDAVVPAGGTATVGFTATSSATSPSPTAFTVNGATCTV